MLCQGKHESTHWVEDVRAPHAWMWGERQRPRIREETHAATGDKGLESAVLEPEGNTMGQPKGTEAFIETQPGVLVGARLTKTQATTGMGAGRESEDVR